jgi:methyltransferase (TIGR00027 family)
MTSHDALINDVSDTALWVAYYRAVETNRSDALFRDPLAAVLIGERGKKIAEYMQSTARYTEWSVVIRTVIIDDYINNLIKAGIDTVINLGAGLDTRPYRMNLPKSLRWIEVDYPHIVDHKDNALKSEVPSCQLTRIAADLANDSERNKLLLDLGSQCSKALIITEGVIPYLTEDQTAALARDLFEQPAFAYWITEYFSPGVYRYLQTRRQTEKMKNAPFQFFPINWFGFFERHGWKPNSIRFTTEESIRLHRAVPMPWFAFLFKLLASKATIEKSKKMTGYILFEKATAID